MNKTQKRLRSLRKRVKVLGQGAQNAFELLSQGGLGAPYRAPFEEVLRQKTATLRRYTCPREEGLDEALSPILFVPPLMVTSEIYDISPEMSAVAWLASQGVDVWLVDFGSPDARDGGLERTLDDHILAVSEAVDVILKETGHDVHLAGYSQGGMFAYQAAAYRQSEGLASLITLGSPVDLRRNLPVKVHDDLAETFIRAAGAALSTPIQKVEKLPATLTSTGFKLLSPRKEFQQLVGIFGALHNREELERREPRRRFLSGDGFVAWPGPAFREFVDNVIVQNRMASGGFVINGQAVTLADITTPILCFIGAKDDMARPASVRGIVKAAPQAAVKEQLIEAGHFGLVVGSKAMTIVWPSVLSWLRSAEVEIVEEKVRETREDASGSKLLYDLVTELADGLWHRVGEASLNMMDLVETMRWQLPRLAHLESLDSDSRVNSGKALADQAAAIPEKTFLLWRDRAYSYEEANHRVNMLLTALYGEGVRPRDYVGVLMDNHPDLLTVVCALNRMGAVAVLVNSGARGVSLSQALEVGKVAHLVVDGAHLDIVRDVWREKPRLVLGRKVALEEGDIVLEPVEGAVLPEGLPLNQGRARDLAMLLFTSGTTGFPKAARITNRRWAMAALGAAAASRLTPSDTVYCCLPLHHATGMLVAVGGAMVGGSRLVLAPRFSTATFWEDVRRNGVTVVYYVGEMCRYLVNAPPVAGERHHPVRLFAGNGMRCDVWERLKERLGAELQVLEFYGSTEGNVALVNLSGEKVGSIGRPMAGVGEIALLQLDEETREYRRESGWCVPSGVNETGELIARVHAGHPLGHFDGYTDHDSNEAKLLRDVFELGDCWFSTGDLMRCDAEGDYWFEDRLGDTYRWRGENVSTEQVSAVLSQVEGVGFVAVYGVEVEGCEGRAGMAALELISGHEFDGEALFRAVDQNLFAAARPVFVRLEERLEMTSSLKVVKARLSMEGSNPETLQAPVYAYDAESESYERLDGERYAALLGVLR